MVCILCVCVPTVINMHILFHEQAVCARNTKMEKKTYLIRKRKTALWFYHSLAGSKTCLSSSKNRSKKD